MDRFLPFSLFWLVLCSAAAVPALAQSLPTGEIKPRPLYTQCASLKEGTSEAVTKSIAALQDKDPKVRQEAARQLGTPCDARAVEPLTAALKDEEPLVRIAVVEALGQLGAPDATEPLIDTISDKDWRVRVVLIGALASYRTVRPRNLVVNGIAHPNGADISDPDDMRVRCIAILTANQLTDISYSRKSINFLYLFTKSSHAPIRALAEQTLYELKNTRNGVNELIGILKTEHNFVMRVWASQWLGKLRVERARRALTEAATEDTEDLVRQAAAEALKALGPEQ